MIEDLLKSELENIVKNLYNIEDENLKINLEQTNSDFEGDYTFVVFPYLKLSKKSPEVTANEIGRLLIEKSNSIKSFNVIKGFLNIVIKDEVWLKVLTENINKSNFGFTEANAESPTIVVEYSSPNTNKPLHLGHIRNNLIGNSISKILSANGNNVKQVNLINDRGIHICKTMLAWIKWGNNITPESSGIKGDKLVGDFYVKFENSLKEEKSKLCKKNMNDDECEEYSELMNEARELLLRWENYDHEVRHIWNIMNKWVLDGFQETYKRMNINFDKYYYESETYLLGKEIVREGLEKGTFIEKNDSSIWIDLTNDGLDEKLLLRSDGTSVYITQDIGTALKRQEEFDADKMIYVVGNEQNYHFQVLKLILKKLGYNWSDDIIHLSYGMVELPDGKMKSREGKVVDADDLMNEMHKTAALLAQEAGKASSLSENDAKKTIEMIAQAALKYFILRVDAKKNMTFNPEDSIDFNGNTGPFIQYTYARINSLLNKANDKNVDFNPENLNIETEEKQLLTTINNFPKVIDEAATQLNPSLIAQYAYELAKTYNQFYQNHTVLREADQNKMHFKIQLSDLTAKVLKSACYLLGIDMPEVM